MSTSGKKDFQVVVAGAGPVGMATAIELALRGIRTLICDPRAVDDYNVGRINLTNARSMEHFRRWGIAEQLRANDPVPLNVVRDLTYSTRANGRIILNVEGAYEWREQPPFTAEVPEWAPHQAIERSLREKILSLESATFLPLTVIKDFSQDENGVSLIVEDKDGARTVSADYFVIADGAQSEFRKKLNLRMDGTTLFYNQAWHFRAPDLAKLFGNTQLSSMTFFLNEDCYGDILIPQSAEGHWLYHVTPMPEGVEADDWPAFRNMLYRSIGEEFEIFEPVGRYFASQARLATSFNFGRAVLVGDAAHLTSPFGGFGMNMGIGDAVDIGWKIAATLQGWGGPRLIETYTLERRDVCKYIIEGAAHNNQVAGKVLVRPHMEEDSERGDKARAEVREFIIREKTQQSRSFGAQFGYRYTTSPIVIGDGTELPPLKYGEYTPSSVAGCRAPHLWLGEKDSLYDHFGPGFTLLKLDPQVDTAVIEKMAAEIGLPLLVYELNDDAARALYEHKLALIRPDQHVAWRGDALPEDCRWLLDVVRGAVSYQ
ncbi:FAD-dependent monooxygenase [Sphingobium sp. SJ10-10]|uniref:FAD-dependent monooxygenase n=1 Tax=Sphingobium sp. SJ10-10 TaxID=3114999 RepID=UPI002E19C015|nr:FAD-dependent monooxygenase [Sphingobium sp. SJ10-10]